MILLSEVVAEVESKGLLHVVRFEPHWYDRLMRKADEPAVAAVAQTCRRAHNWPPWVSFQTVAAFLSCSWGRYQILGWNIYAHMLYEGPLWLYVLDPEAQYRTFERFLATFNMFDDDFQAFDDRALHRFAVYYNGPARPAEYVARLRSAYSRLREARDGKRG